MESLEVQLSRIMQQESLKAHRAAEAAAKEAAELTAKQLKANSPRKAKRGGKYARGWQVKKAVRGTLTGYVVYNGRYPGLTHLLENGHVARNQYGSWGRVRAIKHIAPAADAGIQRFELSFRARMNRG